LSPAKRANCGVIVVGAGPAGSAAAAHLARAGVEALVLDKAAFPREKVCGDGLTPKAVRELDLLGVQPDATWRRNIGLRVYGGGHRLELPWPASGRYPRYGLTKPRAEFDQILLDHARAAGAGVRLATTVLGPMTDHRGRVIGVEVRGSGERGAPVERLRAPIVIAADGASARLATAVGRLRAPGRPMGVAARTYFRANHDSDYIESHLELRDARGRPAPGYGWVFPLADGRVNVGCGSIVSSRGGGRGEGAGWRARLEEWVAAMPGGWELSPDQALAKTASAALPMAFGRRPLARDGLLVVGDAAGLVSPFNGEGVAEAMMSGRLAARACAAALRRPAGERDRALTAYPRALEAELGGYYTLGRIFAQLIARPAVMRAATRYGLPRPVVMRLVMKLLSGLYEPKGGDWMDRLIATLARLAPAG
jgi:geranylgeranyl reductase family protein